MRATTRTYALIVAAGLAAVTTASLSAQPATSAPVDLAGMLALAGERVAAYYERVESIVCSEVVRFQMMDRGLEPDPHVRQLAYELRISREKPADGAEALEAKVLRTLKKVNGKPPKPGDEPKCLDPKSVSLDPLSFLLPEHQREYKFTYKGIGKAGDGRTGVMIDYVPLTKKAPEFIWTDSCVSIDAPARTKGRLWLDRFGGDVLRIDETMVGPIEIAVPRTQERKSGLSSLTVDRTDVSIRYKLVTFTEPNEIVLLPDLLEEMVVTSGGGVPRQRTTHTFSGYQRFVTSGKLIEP